MPVPPLRKVTEFPAAAAVEATDLVPIVRNPAGAAATERATWQQIAESTAFAGFTTLTVSATSPVSPDEEDLWIDSSDYTLYVRQGSAWVEVTQVGPQGLSAYQVAVENGFVGTESAWLASLEGTNVTITVAADQAAFDAATPTATELVVLYAEA